MVRVALKQSSTSRPQLSAATSLVVACLIVFGASILAVNLLGALRNEPESPAPLPSPSPLAALRSNDEAATSEQPRDKQASQQHQEHQDGFFDYSDDEWRRKKEIYQSSQPNFKKKRYANSNEFWNGNFDPEFTCNGQRRLGGLGDGGKWICDVHRITGDSCLVYSIGSNGNAHFEKEMHTKLSQQCNSLEIHTFDIKGWNKRNGLFKDRVAEAGGVFHEWGITVDTMDFEKSEYFIPKVYRTLNFKTFGQTFEQLGHLHRTIDVLKIDCEGCEWQSIQGWFADWEKSGVQVKQLLLELHDSPKEAYDFFDTLKQHGYVIFHKEVTGTCAEYAFIKLEASFFQ